MPKPIAILIYILTAPSSPPENLTATPLSPTSILMAWSPPPRHSQNGIIREYRVKITEVETGRELNFSTSSTSITVPLLHPYYTYDCVVRGYTVLIGPYANVTVMTPEDGMLKVDVVFNRIGINDHDLYGK